MRGSGLIGELALEAVFIGLLLFMQLMVTTALDREDAIQRPLDALAYALIIVGALGVFTRRLRPAIPAGIALVVLCTYFIRGYVMGPVFLTFAIALIIAQLGGKRRQAWLAGGVFLVLLAIAGLTGFGQEMVPGQWFGMSSAVVVVIVVSDQVRVRREAARQRARAEAEQARRMSSEQRVQLARELHDVLAHSLSVINVQAGVALHLLDDRAQVESSLHIIRNTSRETLAEVRDTLNSLRGHDAAPTAPAVGLADLDRLTRASQAAGLDTTLTMDLDGRELPAGVDIAAYRIVQEALTNVSKHSSARRAEVEVRLDGGDVLLRVADDGPAKPREQDAGGSGHGINGMRERASALGGRLHAAPTGQGGFLVEARIPAGGRA